jgi:hypothetical protein
MPLFDLRKPAGAPLRRVFGNPGLRGGTSFASVKRITTAMALFIAEWCGVEPRAL